MTRKVGNTMNIVKEVCRDIHSQLGDIDKVSVSLFLHEFSILKVEISI